MKARIRETNHYTVVLEHDDEMTSERVRREFVGSPGGYVRELRSDGSTTQPCGYLYPTGETLRMSGWLIDTIRREWRRRQDQERACARRER